ncbi:MAG: ACP S-malonyltransferase [Clostridiales bacterium]
MSKTAFIFAGQGAQYIGMGQDFAKEYETANKIFDSADNALGFSIKDLIFNSNDEKLKITENTQPSILTTSVAILNVIMENGIKPDIVAGLSLGEYTAHVAAGTISFEEAVKLVRKRGKFMQEAVPIGVGTMAAIIGLEKEDVIECCNISKSLGVVEPANFNCPGQIVIAGEVKAVEAAVEKAKEKGSKRAMILPVSAPFHCSLLKKAGENLSKELETIEFKNMNIPVVSNVTGDFIEDKNQIKDLLIKQVSSSVLWLDGFRKMIDFGVDTFIEIGPGKVLSGFNRKIDRKMRSFNIEDIPSMEKTISKI